MSYGFVARHVIMRGSNMALQAGTRLGPYEVLSLIGAGGMGEVYRARDTKLARDVALKILRPSIADDPTRLSRLTREAQVLASLNHPHIGAIYGLEEFEGLPALVLELVEGDTLADRIARGPMPFAEVLPVATQIAEALEAAHEQGIVHRDLKPANIKLRPDGKVKVLDFGLAKALDPASASSHDLIDSPTYTVAGTTEGTILGTAPYMSPEQARGKRVDKRADIWAFGVVLYEMLTGHRPFVGPTVSDTLAAILTTEPSYNRLPAEARSLIRKCLAKDPKQRLRDVGDARLTLGESDTADAIPQRRRRPVLAWGISGALSVALVSALWAAWRTEPMSQAPLIRLNLTLDTTQLALSPDGTRLAYSAANQLYMRRLDEEQSVPLPGTEGGGIPSAGIPFFSPDGRSLAFFADAKLKRISVEGGSLVVLCDAPDARGGTWGEDGTIILAPRVTGSLVRLSSDGGATQAATTLDQARHEITHRWPQILPGGQVVLYTAHSATGNYEDATIEAQSLRTGQRKTLVRGGYYGRYATDGHLLYIRRNTLYAAPMNSSGMELTGTAVPVVENIEAFATVGYGPVDVTRNGMLVYGKRRAFRATLSWFDTAGHTESLLRAGEYYGGPRLSPDGKRLAVGMRVDASGDSELWVHELARGAITRLTFARGADHHPVWSPDGNHIVFASERHGGPPNLYWMRSDGSGQAVRLTNRSDAQRPTSFSPDGRRLLYTQEDPPNQSDVWTLTFDDIHGDRPKVIASEPFLQTPFAEDAATLSPDGRWVAYESTESGRREVYVRPFAGQGGKWAVSTDGGSHPVWSRAKPQLLYSTDDGIMAVSYTSTGQTFIPGKPQVWLKKTVLDFDLAADGRRCIVAQEETVGEPGPRQLTFLLNFFGELRRRVNVAR